jgi:hypothetical protein
MTSNQLAHEANKLQGAYNAELSRHNQMIEEESVRHNTETENIAKDTNTIEKRKLNETTRHNATMELIQQEYNGIYKQMQQADQARKKELETRLAELEQEKVAAENVHKANMDKLTKEQNDLVARRDAETARHNKVVEANDATLTNISYLQEQNQERRTENEALYREQAINISEEANKIRRNEVNNNLYLGLQNLDVNAARVNADIQQVQGNLQLQQSQIDLNNAKIGEAITNSIANSFGSLSEGIKAIKILNAF